MLLRNYEHAEMYETWIFLGAGVNKVFRFLKELKFKKKEQILGLKQSLDRTSRLICQGLMSFAADLTVLTQQSFM